jgi:hypothetical protein
LEIFLDFLKTPEKPAFSEGCTGSVRHACGKHTQDDDGNLNHDSQ